jgi:hypothetical protein
MTDTELVAIATLSALFLEYLLIACTNLRLWFFVCSTACQGNIKQLPQELWLLAKAFE